VERLSELAAPQRLLRVVEWTALAPLRGAFALVRVAAMLRAKRAEASVGHRANKPAARLRRRHPGTPERDEGILHGVVGQVFPPKDAPRDGEGVGEVRSHGRLECLLDRWSR